MAKRKKKSGLRKIIRGLYRTLGIVNTATYIVGGNPAKLAKHLTRKRTSKFGSRIVR